MEKLKYSDNSELKLIIIKKEIKKYKNVFLKYLYSYLMDK